MTTELTLYLRRILASAVIAVFGAVLLGPIQNDAWADQFNAPAGPPTLTALSLDEVGGTFVQFEPAWSTSDKTYEVTTTVSKPGGIASDSNGNGGLQNGLTLCLYLNDSADAEDNCLNDAKDGINTSPDPQTTFLMTWNWDKTQTTDAAANVFTVINDANNHYVDDGSSSTYTKTKEAAGDVSATVSFRFKVSSAMRESTDWAIKVTADDGSNPVVEQSLGNLRAAYFGSIRMQRPAKAFAVQEDGSDLVEGAPLGDYTSNASSDVTFTASHFTRDDDSDVKLMLSSPLLDYDCSPTSTFDSGQAKNINTTSAIDFTTVGLISSESAEPIGDHSCRLEYIRGLSVADKSFSNDVTVAITRASANAPGNLRSEANTETSVELKWQKPDIIGSANYSYLGATFTNYVIEISTDGGTSWQFLDRITDASSTVTYQVTNLSERNNYDFRVTANTSESSGFATLNVATASSASFSLAMLQELNDTLKDNTEDDSAESIVDEIESITAGTLKVFASPTYGALAERMSAQTSKITAKGRFNRTLFDSTDAIAVVDGFSAATASTPSNLNGKPFIGFVAFGENTFYGSALMSFHEVSNSSGNGLETADATTRLADVFRYNAFSTAADRDFYGYVLNANGTSVDFSNSRSSTRWSDGMSSGSNGYDSTSRFSADDITLGIAGGVTSLDGNGGAYFRSHASVSYGVENDNSSDNQTEYYWGGARNSTDYVYYFFHGVPTP